MGRKDKKRRREEERKLQLAEKAQDGTPQGAGDESANPVVAIEEEVVDDDQGVISTGSGIQNSAVDEHAVDTELKSAELGPEKLFRLNVAPAHGTSAVLQFTWCLTPKALEILRAKQVMHPFIVVSAFAREDNLSGVETLEPVDRVLLPLDRAIGQIEFTRPGKFKVCASIVWSPIESQGRGEAAKNLFDLFMVRDNNKFRYSMSDRRSYKPMSLHDDYYLYHHERIDVNIDASFFAKKPPEWLWWWANLWHEATPRNQCLLRRRLIFAFTLKPIFALSYTLLIFVLRLIAVIVAFLVSFRYISLKPLFHPFAMTFDNLFPNLHGQNLNAHEFFSITKKDGTKRAPILQIILIPFMWLPIIDAFFVLNYYFGESIKTTLEKVLLSFFLWAGVLTALTIVYCIGKFIVNAVAEVVRAADIDKRKAAKEGERKAQKAKEEAERKQAKEEAGKVAQKAAFERYYTQRLEPLSCADGGPRIADLRAVPKTHRTVWMYFDDFKARVCKPFAQ